MNDCVIICGDFNHSSINWNTLHAGNESQEFVDFILDCFLIPHIREPTRGENVLNLVLSSIDCMIDDVKMCEPFSSSDHNIITLDQLYDSHITTWKEYCFNYRRGNYKETDKSQRSVDWDPLFSHNNVNEKWAIFREVLDTAVSKLVPRWKRRLDEKNHGGQEALVRPGS